MLDKNNDTISKLVNLIIQNDLYFEKEFPLIFEKKAKELYFLSNKRYPENRIKSNDFFLKKEINLCKKKMNSINDDNFKINIKFRKKNFMRPNINNNFFFNLLESPKSPINSNNLYQIDNCINMNYIVEQKMNNNNNMNENIFKYDIDNSQNDNNENNDNNNNDIIYESKSSSINNKRNFNNDIRVKKNNKIIYMNSYLIKPKNIKKNNIEGEKKRSSKYRGVSKNGNQWQAIMFSKKNKSYIGSYPSEELAARIYDIICIKNRGIKAKTNFEYNVEQIQAITETNIDVKSKNIKKILSKLLK